MGLLGCRQGCGRMHWSGPLKLINALKVLIWYVYLEGTVFVGLGSAKNGVNRYMLSSDSLILC